MSKQQSNLWYAVRFAVALVMILDSFRRHDAFEYTMLAVGIAVLVLTSYQFFAQKLRDRTIRKRKAVLFPVLRQGEELLRQCPLRTASQIEIDTWRKHVADWIAGTASILAQYSTHATASFQHDVVSLDPNIRVRIHEFSVETHRELRNRLTSLRGILERPEIYFLN